MINPIAIKVTEHSDSQHGWMAVKRKDVHKILGLENVSSYSYQKGNTVYLECDRDLTLFMQAVEKQGIQIDSRIAKHYDSSPIRNYQSFHIIESDYIIDSEGDKIIISGMKEREFSDHEFAKYLTKNNSIKNHIKPSPDSNVVKWIDDNKNLTALAVYNNSNCTRQIFTTQ